MHRGRRPRAWGRLRRTRHPHHVRCTQGPRCRRSRSGYHRLRRPRRCGLRRIRRTYEVRAHRRDLHCHLRRVHVHLRGEQHPPRTAQLRFRSSPRGGIHLQRARIPRREGQGRIPLESHRHPHSRRRPPCRRVHGGRERRHHRIREVPRFPYHINIQVPGRRCRRRLAGEASSP